MILIPAIFLCLFIALLCGATWSASKNVRRIAAMPRRAIGDLEEATRARIAGFVKRHGAWAVAPLTKRPCVCWTVTLSVLDQYTARHIRWNRVLTETGGVPFVLDDGTGKALLDPAEAVATIRVTHRRAARFKLRDHERDFLERHGVELGRGLGRRKFMFEESIVVIGQPIAAVGAGFLEPIDAANHSPYRDPAARWLRIGGRLCELELTDSRLACR